MTKLDLIKLYKKLTGIKGNKDWSKKFNFAVGKNLKIIQPDIDVLAEIEKDILDEEFQEYQKELVELGKKYADRDDNGDIIYNNNNDFLVDNNNLAFKEELEMLKLNYKDALDKRKRSYEEYTEMLKEESDVVLYKIDFDIFPETGLDGDDYIDLGSIIKED